MMGFKEEVDQRFQQVIDQATGQVGWIDKETGTPVQDPEVALKQAQENSHAGFFSGRENKRLIIAEEEIADDFATAKQRMRRVDKLTETFQKSLQNPTLQRVDAVSDRVMKVSWKEYLDVRKDPNFTSFAVYGQSLMFYCDAAGQPDLNRPRPVPVRPLLQNEVGILRRKDGTEKIVVIKDQDPDGVGTVYAVPDNLTGLKK